jgi:hypothetical protein
MGNVSYLHLIILFLDDQIAGSIKRRASGFKKLAGLSVLRATNIYIWDCGGRIVDRVEYRSLIIDAFDEVEGLVAAVGEFDCAGVFELKESEENVGRQKVALADVMVIPKAKNLQFLVLFVEVLVVFGVLASVKDSHPAIEVPKFRMVFEFFFYFRLEVQLVLERNADFV